MEKVLLFGMGEAETKLIKRLSDNMRIQVQEVTPAAYDLTIKQIISEKNSMADIHNKNADNDNMSSLILFCELSDKHLDKFLFELKSKKSQIDYKAVLTPSNQNWTVRQLFAHMEMEKRRMM